MRDAQKDAIVLEDLAREIVKCGFSAAVVVEICKEAWSRSDAGRFQPQSGELLERMASRQKFGTIEQLRKRFEHA